MMHNLAMPHLREEYSLAQKGQLERLNGFNYLFCYCEHRSVTYAKDLVAGLLLVSLKILCALSHFKNLEARWECNFALRPP